MNIFSHHRLYRKPGIFRFFSRGHLITGLVAGVALGGAGLWTGFGLGLKSAEMPESQLVVALKSLFERERQLLADAEARTQEHLDAYGIRLGQMQAQILRIDALGQRLAELGKLDKTEFDFNEDPAQGGPETQSALGDPLNAAELESDIAELSKIIADRERKLALLEDLIMVQNLHEEVSPKGRPIKKGWISSYFGKRKDPFTGRKAMHRGVDFAGKKGSEVVSVAAGIVTWAGDRYGYGNLIEIQHGNGYTTRYGHNERMLVEVGDRVAQGQTIATMGSSGRSTGPHVHFEVLLNGKKVNPTKYTQLSRK